MKKLIIFDLDDTLIHLEVDWAKVKSEVFSLAKKNGMELDLAQHLIPMSNLVAARPDLKSGVDEIYRKNEAGCILKKSYKVYPDMIALVRELKKKEFKLAIASGNHSKNIEDILRHLNLSGHFDVICGRDRAKRGKPFPDQLTVIIQKTKISRKNALFIGDSVNDQAAAKAEGMDFFKVEKGGTKDTTELRRAIGLFEKDEE
jgi:HAD superfamily hydrolase (TIGR01509 family)